MKKIGILLLSLLLVFTVVGLIFAKDLEVIYESEEITDTEKLFQRAEKGISDLENEKIPEYVVLKNESGEEKYAKKYQTTQLLKVIKDENGNKINKYATTALVFVDKNLFEGKQENKVKTSVYYGDEGFDSTYSVKAYGTVYWTNTIYRDVEFFDIDKYTGGWEIVDSQVTISNRYVRATASGTGTNGFPLEQVEDFYPSSNTFSYVNGTDFNYSPVSKLAGMYLVGEKLGVKITRGGSSWIFSFDIMVP